jgi:hypothetical protein
MHATGGVGGWEKRNRRDNDEPAGEDSYPLPPRNDHDADNAVVRRE